MFEFSQRIQNRCNIWNPINNPHTNKILSMPSYSPSLCICAEVCPFKQPLQFIIAKQRTAIIPLLRWIQDYWVENYYYALNGLYSFNYVSIRIVLCPQIDCRQLLPRSTLKAKYAKATAGVVAFYSVVKLCSAIKTQLSQFNNCHWFSHSKKAMTNSTNESVSRQSFQVRNEMEIAVCHACEWRWNLCRKWNSIWYGPPLNWVEIKWIAYSLHTFRYSEGNV